MLKDALEFLAGLATSSVKVADKIHVLPMPGHRHKHFVVSYDGTADITRSQPPSRSVEVSSIDQLPGVIQAYDAVGKCTIWVNDKTHKILAVLDDVADSFREDFAKLNLILTDEYRTICQSVENEEWVDNKGLIRLLRTVFADAIPEKERRELIRVLKTVKFKSSATTTSNVQRTKESLGREFDAEFESSAGEIPEVISMNLRVYDDSSLVMRHPVKVEIDVDPPRGLLCLVPSPGDVKAAQDKAIRQIVDRLKESCPNTFIGQFNQ